jgi:hypothetical protein
MNVSYWEGERSKTERINGQRVYIGQLERLLDQHGITIPAWMRDYNPDGEIRLVVPPCPCWTCRAKAAWRRWLKGPA